MDDYLKQTLKAYDANPEQYENATLGIVAEPELKEFVERLPSRELPVLDAGCAFGRDSALLSEKGVRVIGIDMSEALLTRARELNPDIDFRNMDVRQLDFANESFGGIWCNAVLIHLHDEDVVRALSEFTRVLSPGGISFVTFKHGEGEEVRQGSFTNSAPRYYKFQTVESLTGLIEQAGMTVERIYQVNEKERWGLERADELIHCFARKES